MRELISARRISERVRELGAQIERDYADGGDLILIGMLRGSVVFLADLMRCIDLPLRIGFIGIHRYAGTTGGDLRMSADVTDDLKGTDVIVVEDIIEHGTTLNACLELLRAREPRSIAIAALLSKPQCTKFEFPELRYTGFEIGSEFVVGYGLDHDQRYRNLPYIAVYAGE